ncbi:hypothetical protein [Clostridium sp.]|uniref:hypothetical protein n=1 Tax=Clostridium sp. TaxID=1506 RepID=UPI003D6C95B1
MSVSIDFKNAVSEGKTRLVRIILKDSLIIDPTFAEFDEMFSYSKEKMDNILEEFDDGELDYDKNHWSENYMNEIKVELMGNFSRERIKHLKEICSYIYVDKVKTIREQRRNTSSPSVVFTRRTIAKGAVAGGVAIAVVGVAVAEQVIVATGAVVALAGVAVLLSEK